ncbi:WD40-repeat-containing domain protein [Scheffersomyces coipomensis]|uniref:WD40-repeat-containing domain protein n=1 Tax=Scheffersomyces coipomensis TaxID=1788519 RepID=UPI00315D32D7
MSLTSTELNYLVWRYLQEAGFELAAFALEKNARCSDYERDDNSQLISKIQPGCLVNLVQKGMLYSLAEDEASEEPDKNNLSFFGTLLREEIENGNINDEDTNGDEDSEKKRFLLKSEVPINGTNETTTEMEIDSIEETSTQTSNEEFTTKIITPRITYDESLVSSWHPSTEVFAYGKDNSSAIINAIKDDSIAESVNLVHPNVLNLINEINVVSWSPHGNVLVTAGSNGELRAWSPDGKLRNIAHLFNDDIPVEGASTPNITDLLWSESGQLLLCIDTHGQVSIWNGNTLSLIKQINPPHISDNSNTLIAATWLGDDKFAVSTIKNSIKIYSVDIQQQPADIQTVGFLHGHENTITNLKLNDQSKLLASSSDFDYQIKVWSRGSSQEGLDLNVPGDSIKPHNSPIVGLEWLQNLNNTDSVLLSVSIDGVLNIWNAVSGVNLLSTELFKNSDNFKISDESDVNIKQDALVFTVSLSSDHKYLALGDDLGRVSIWDVSSEAYTSSGSGPKSVLKCLAVFAANIPNDLSSIDSKTGICDIHWDNSSANLSVSYRGVKSVILGWKD